MRILADENLRGSLIRALRENGHDVLSIAESQASILDPQVLHLANQDDRVLLTEDVGFSNLVFKEKLSASSVILLRFPGVDPAEQIEIVLDFLSKNSDLRNLFVVITKAQIRVKTIL